ncbi:hypothetical protein DET49_104151 [Salegentibacter sp. 24]|nr:hypothetical protein DET49_104151 [Salegentibacter sp. 24]
MNQIRFKYREIKNNFLFQFLSESLKIQELIFNKAEGGKNIANWFKNLPKFI